MRSISVIIVIMLLLLLSGCNNKEKQAKLAENDIYLIEELINNKSYNLAKVKIDSFHVNYRMLVDKRKIVNALQDTITLRESLRNIQYCDSILPELLQKMDSISKKFKFEKDTLFEETGNFVHKMLLTEKNTGRNYLKIKTDENGELKIFSIISGSKINHNLLRVSSGEYFAETDTVVRTIFSEHGYNDGENYYESVIFGGTSAENIVKFIYENQNSKIKVSLKGNRELSYFLNLQDLKSIVESYHFWILKRDIVKINKQIINSTIKINRIKSIIQ